MLTQHGWKSEPSPRRGFTMIDASRDVSESPVVVAIHDSPHALRLFRSAVDEAMSRSLELIVLDYGATSLRDRIGDAAEPLDARERSTLGTLWANSHVHVIREEPVDLDLGRTISYCESISASMLVLSADDLGSANVDAERVFNSDFDVLVITEHSARDRRDQEPEPDGA